MPETPFADGALLIHKPAEVSSFGVIDQLKRQWMQVTGVRHSQLPKLGHGGTLDPFATGLLVILIGNSVKLARYFLGAHKSYEGTMSFGSTTVPGDPTSPVSETTAVIPESLERLQTLAEKLSRQAYLQIPPMHSAKKHHGQPLYKLARSGIEVEREPRTCHLYEFKIDAYSPPIASFRVKCSSGTYVRTLAQDFGKILGSLAMLQNLTRTASGNFTVKNAWQLSDVLKAISDGSPLSTWNCFVPFDRLLDGFARTDVSSTEAAALMDGRQSVLLNIVQRSSPSPMSPDSESNVQAKDRCLAIYVRNRLLAVARNEDKFWKIDRVFSRALS